MQLVDRNGVSKKWNTLKYGYDLKTICISSGCNLKVPYYQIEKISLNKITILIHLRQHSIILFDTQESLRFKN